LQQPQNGKAAWITGEVLDAASEKRIKYRRGNSGGIAPKGNASWQGGPGDYSLFDATAVFPFIIEWDR